MTTTTEAETKCIKLINNYQLQKADTMNVTIKEKRE